MESQVDVLLGCVKVRLAVALDLVGDADVEVEVGVSVLLLDDDDDDSGGSADLLEPSSPSGPLASNILAMQRT